MAKRNNNLLYGALVLVALLIAAAVWKGQSKPKGLEVEVEKVKKRTIKETVSASGKISPEKEVKISSDVSGEVVELYVAEGDSVKMGQLLCRVDADAYQSAVERGEAGVNNAKANVANLKAGIARSEAQLIVAQAEVERTLAQIENTRAIHKRNEDLFKTEIISNADFEASLATLQGLEANLRSAKANVKSAEANLEAAIQSKAASEFSVKSQQASLKEMKTNLRRTTIYAPTDGIVSMLNIEQGERVVGTIQMTGTEIMRIANMNSMEIEVDVSETDVLRVSIGDEVSIEVDAYLDKKFKGTVTEIANSASGAGSSALSTDQVTNFVVKARIDPASYADLLKPNRPHPFRPGMSASIDITTEVRKDVVCVPIQAVTTRDKKDKDDDKEEGEESAENETEDEEVDEDDEVLEVLFLSEGGKAKMVEVTTGIQDDDYIEVTSDLSLGAEVISGPFSAVSKKLKDDKTIRIKEDKKKKKKKSK